MDARLPILVGLALMLACGAAAAQPTSASPPSAATDTGTTSPPASSVPVPLQALSPNALTAWVGGSFATGHVIGNVQRARLGLLGLRYDRLLIPAAPDPSTDGPTLTYSAQFLPVLRLSIPSESIVVPPTGHSSPAQQRDLDTYGIGVSPAGLRVTFRVRTRVQPFLEGSTGITYFTKPVPTAWGRQLNFTFDVGAGVQVVLTPTLILTAGYRYHHLSNGFRGQINPGVDANLLHFGVSFTR